MKRFFLSSAVLLFGFAARASACHDTLALAPAWHRLQQAWATGSIVGIRVLVGKNRRTVRGRVVAVDGEDPKSATFEFVDAATGHRVTYLFLDERGAPRVVVN